MAGKVVDILAWLAIACGLAFLVLCSTSPVPIDHMEIPVMNVSWALVHGQPMYAPPLDRVPFHCLTYGPVTALVIGSFLAVAGWSLEAGRICCCLFTVLGAGLLAWTLAGLKTIDGKRSLLTPLRGGALFVLMVLVFEGRAFWIRPDPFLIFAVCFALAVTTRCSRWPAAIGLGLALAFAVDLKIHGFLVLLPACGILLDRHGWRACIVAGTTGLALAVVPYLHPLIEWNGLWAMLEIQSRHEREWRLGLSIALGMAGLAWPLWSEFARLVISRPADVKPMLRREWACWVGFAAGVAGNLVIGSKIGAGAGHFAPMVPVVIYLAARLNTQSGEASLTPTRWLAMGWGAFVVVLAAMDANCQRGAIYRSFQYRRQFKDAAADVRKICDTLPGQRIAMGTGTRDSYWLTSASGILLERGNPFLVETACLMDLQAAGVPFRADDLLDPALTDVWLIPRGDNPWSIQNLYLTGEVYPREFQEAFARRWEIRGGSRFFDLWMPREAAPAPAP